MTCTVGIKGHVHVGFFFTVFQTPSEDLGLKISIGDEVANTQRLSCHGARVVVLRDPLQDGFSVKADSASAHERVHHQFLRDGAEEVVRNVFGKKGHVCVLY